MSIKLNIPVQLVKVASACELTVDTELFTPRQRSTFLRTLKTGVSRTAGAPADVAFRLRKAGGLPCIKFGRFGYLQWCNISEQEHPQFWEKVAATITYLSMQSEVNYSRVQACKYALEMLTMAYDYKLATHRCWIPVHYAKQTKKIFEKLKFVAAPVPESRYVNVVISNKGE